MWGLLLLLGGAGLWLGVSSATAEAATLNVANNGVDSAVCGSVASPCRSISKAIANAAPGDTILVGAGVYGDLDADGNFTPATGEEAAEVGFGCQCMIKVDKALTIISRDGADATVLDATQSAGAVVKIQASGVVFGLPKRGFTLWRGLSGGLVIGAPSDVRVAGNVAKFNGTACPCPPGTLGSGFVVTGGAGHVITGNLSANNNGQGFGVDGSGHTLSRNLVVDVTGAGFFVLGTGHTANRNISNNIGGAGFFFDGTGFVISDNVTGASGGFQISGNGHAVKGNVSSGNYGASPGFFIAGSGHVVARNAARGNEGSGIFVNSGSSGLIITRNDLYGNGRNDTFTGVPNCGLFNDSGTTITATNNFWGAATGPGPDPADDVCDGPGSTTITAPFATTEFPVPTFSIF
jgi:hypothetical protein